TPSFAVLGRVPPRLARQRAAVVRLVQPREGSLGSGEDSGLALCRLGLVCAGSREQGGPLAEALGRLLRVAGVHASVPHRRRGRWAQRLLAVRKNPSSAV